MSIYFLRHIKTIYNTNNLISGCKDVEPLPGQTLVLPNNLDLHFDYVISSPLKRCRATVDLLPAQLYDRVEFSDKLLERNAGVLEGLSKKDAVEQFPYLFCNGKIDVHASILNGEAITDVVKRLAPIADKLASYQDTMDILVCSHNQTLKVLLALLKEIPISNDYWRKIDFQNGTLININNIPIIYY